MIIQTPEFFIKPKCQGTGLGLNMSYRLITEGMNGKIIANNKKYIFENKEYISAEFKILLPIVK